jgi:tetratricopeptide (TPR) repeat protein
MVFHRTYGFRALACCTVLALLLPSAVRADDAEELPKLLAEYRAQYKAGRYQQAEPIARQMLAMAEKSGKPETIGRHLNIMATVYWAEGRYAEAEPLFKRAIEVRQQALGPEHVDVAMSLAGLAEVYRSQGRYGKAEPLQKRALDIREKALGPDHLKVADSLNDLANVYEDEAKFAQAEPLYKRALAIREKALGPDHTSVAKSINNLAEIYRIEARYREAAELYKRALAILEKNLGPDHPDLAMCLNNMGLLEYTQGHYAAAELLYQRSLALREKVLGPDHPDVLKVVNNLGNLMTNEGKHAEAERLFKRALTTREKVLGREHLLVAASADDLASLYYYQGRIAEAERLAKRALVIRKKNLPADHPSVASSLNDLGLMYKTQGRYAEAEPLLKRALTIRERALPPNHPSTGQSVNNLASLYYAQGRNAEAEFLYKRALAIREKTLGPDHPYVATTLNQLATLARARGHYAEAETLHKRALAIREKTFGPDHADVATSVEGLAEVYFRQKRYAEAEPLYKRALAMREKVLGPDHVDLGLTLVDMAIFYRAQKRYDEAAPLVDRAVAIFDRVGANPTRRYRGYFQRAQLQWSLGHTAEAIADLKKSMDLAEQQRALGSGGERERAQLFAGFAGAFERMVDWQATLGDMAEGLAAMERSRARSLLDQIETHDIDLLTGVPKNVAAALRRREAEVQTRLAGLEKQVQLLDEQKDLSLDDRKRQTEALRAQLRRAHADYVVVYADIRNASPAYRLAVGQDHKPVTLAKLNKWVADQNAGLLEYCLGRETGSVLILRAGAAPRLEKLAVGKDQARALGIEPGALTARRLNGALSNKKGTGVLQLLKRAANPTQAQEAIAGLAVLWELLIPPAERKALAEGTMKRLVVIPDGPLASLPFETLVVRPGPSPQYLLDVGPPIEYAPSATILMNLGERRLSGGEETPPVLTVGNPRYRQPSDAGHGDVLAELGASARYASAGGTLSNLPYTKLEVAWVARVFGQSGVKVTELLRDEATEANVRRDAGGRKILHLACHGLVDQAYGNLFGALALTPGPDVTNAANDGFLTLAEIYKLHLDTTELAILSACDTNYGPQQEGEGVYALSRGFLVAGARRVVASNWLVDDEAAASLIGRFCGRLAADEKKGGQVDYPEALQQAKRWVRQREGWESPYYWGTFVLLGPN